MRPKLPTGMGTASFGFGNMMRSPWPARLSRRETNWAFRFWAIVVLPAKVNRALGMKYTPSVEAEPLEPTLEFGPDWLRVALPASVQNARSSYGFVGSGGADPWLGELQSVLRPDNAKYPVYAGLGTAGQGWAATQPAGEPDAFWNGEARPDM